jgi:predicted RNA-binding Zn ribbon-like protein
VGDVDEDFQPGGRAAAPPPLDLVQGFVNTEIPEWARDDIATPALLEAWLRERDLLEAGERVSAEGFVAARELRSVLRELAVLNTVGAAPDGDVRARLGVALEGAPLRLEIAADGRLVPVPAGPPEIRALTTIALAVLEAQASGAWRRLKACKKESCRWLFYDLSRNASSSWCSMSICGNRVKTAAYRERRRAGS